MIKRLSEIILGDEQVRGARRSISELKLSGQERGHLRDRERKKLSESRAITRRHTLRVLGGGSALALAGGMMGVSLFSKCKTTPTAPTTPAVPDKPSLLPHASSPPSSEPQGSHEQIQALIKYQQERKKWMLHALGKFKDTNPKTRQLLEMLQKYAFYSIPMGPRTTQMIFPKDSANPTADLFNDEHAFEVVFMPEEFSQTLHSSVVWGQDGEHTLRVAAEIENPDWFAAVGYHELGHVWDALWGGEDPSDPAQWTDGEVRAHEVECEVLQTWKPIEYAEFLRQAVPYWRTRNLRAIIALGDRLFSSPGRSRRAQALASSAFITCAAFEAARQDGKDLKRVYREEILPTHQGYR